MIKQIKKKKTKENILRKTYFTTCEKVLIEMKTQRYRNDEIKKKNQTKKKNC